MTALTDAPLVAHLLYPPDASLPDLSGFAPRVNGALARVHLALQDEGRDEAGAHAFVHPLVTLRLRMVTGRCPTPDLAPALAAPFLALKPNDLRAQAARHGQYVEVTVTGTTAPDADDGLPWLMHLYVLHRALLALVDRRSEAVLHMGLSGMLFTRKELLDTADMTLPISLCLHPLPVVAAQAPTIAGVLPPLGMIALGAERFCGKPMTLIPSPLPPREGLALVALILRNHVGGMFRLQDGAHLHTPTHKGILIRHSAPDDGAPEGRILVGLGDWPDPEAPPPRPVDLSELAPQRTPPPIQGPGMMAQAAGRLGQFAVSPNGLITIAGIAAYLLVSQLAGHWFEIQSEMVRTAITPRN